MTASQRPLPAGDYDRRLAVQLRAAGSNELGEATGAWQTVAKVWARVTPLTGREFPAAGTMTETVTHEIRWRYGVPVTREHRLLDIGKGEAFEVISPTEPGRGRSDTVVLCITGVRDGR